MARGWVLASRFTAVSLFIACPSDRPDMVACDPLAARDRPSVELREIVGIGAARDGRLFVIDRTREGIDERLFVSAGGELIEQASFAGSRSESGVQSLAVSTSDVPRTTVIVEQRGGATRMEVVTGEWGREWDLDLQQGEELEVRDAAAIRGMTVRGLPTDVVVEYLARVGDHALLVVLRPMHPSGYDDFRVFFGSPEHVVERELVAFVRGRDGGSTHVLFELDGEEADAFFPNRIISPNVIQTEPVTFTVGGESRAIAKLAPDDTALDAATFDCD